MKIPQKIKALFGFAQKSKQLFSGDTAVKNCIKTNKAQLILIAIDFPEKRKGYFIKWCTEKNIAYILWGTKEGYGELLGTAPRCLIAITDKQMAEEIYRIISEESC
ncbi:MAG: 50S ribosomal protein L7ae [Clostridia bacterium]|jgi:ribosomal protein L7Ae-like RNA K-turn-binding protein|nr:50S ribosomal protein L7ae [Clostridia bacterium]